MRIYKYDFNYLLIIFFVFLLLTNLSYTQTIMVFDAVTEEPVKIGVVFVQYSVVYFEFAGNAGFFEGEYLWYCRSYDFTNDFPLTGEPIVFFNQDEHYGELLGPQTFTIRCPNYEEKEVNMTGYVCKYAKVRTGSMDSPGLRYRYESMPEHKIYIVPQKLNVDANVNIQGQNGAGNKSNELDVYTADEIADFLDVEVTDILKLIKEKKLKAKKIGDTYFIRKEDFDNFMKE